MSMVIGLVIETLAVLAFAGSHIDLFGPARLVALSAGCGGVAGRLFGYARTLVQREQVQATAKRAIVKFILTTTLIITCAVVPLVFVLVEMFSVAVEMGRVPLASRGVGAWLVSLFFSLIVSGVIGVVAGVLVGPLIWCGVTRRKRGSHDP